MSPLPRRTSTALVGAWNPTPGGSAAAPPALRGTATTPTPHPPAGEGRGMIALRWCVVGVFVLSYVILAPPFIGMAIWGGR
jgi:hypothetical protein